jgi:hypothetical protein
LDKKTLKTRLKRLARVITKQFEEAKKQRILGNDTGGHTSVLGWNQHTSNAGILMGHRSSEASTASAASVSSMASLAASSVNSSQSLRDSFSTVNTVDPLTNFRDSLVRGASITIPSISNGNASSITSVSAPEPTNTRTGSSTAKPLGREMLETPPEGPCTDRDENRAKATASPALATISFPQANSINQLPTADDGDKNMRINSSPSQSGTGCAELLNGVTHQHPPVNVQMRQQILENLRREDELTRRIQVHHLRSSVNGDPLGRSSTTGYAANIDLPGTAVPGLATANHFALPNLHSMVGSMNPNQHYVSSLPLNPTSVMAAALLSRNIHAGGGGDQFASMSAGGHRLLRCTPSSLPQMPRGCRCH